MPATFNAVDPRTGLPGASYDEASPADVEAAVAAAQQAFAHPALRDRGARAAMLRGAAGRLRAAGDEIVATAEAETGLPEARLRSELERTAGQLEAFAALLDAGDYVEAILDSPDPDAKPIPRPDVRRMLVPVGPVAVFGASNFPLAFSTAGGDTASALAAGCPVVVKGHPSHPGTGELVAREVRAAIADAGLPEGTFAHLLAAGIEVGEALVDAPAIQAVGFTGSTAGGRAIMDRAARRPQPIPVYAEMGSINPIVVTEAALKARAGAIAEGLVASVATFGGQLCTKPGVVFVPYGEAGNDFVRTVARAAGDLRAHGDAQRARARRAGRRRRAPGRAARRVRAHDGAARCRRRLSLRADGLPRDRARGAPRAGARGALRARRRPAPLRGPRGAARRAPARRGPAHRHRPRPGRTRTPRCSGCSPRRSPRARAG